MGKAENVELGKKALLALIVGLLSLNLLTFLPAYSQIANLDSGCCSNHPLAKDFSGVYIGAWRLFHNPAAVYVHGNVSDGEPQIYPQPEQYKYLPSYLLLVSPVLLLSYQNSIRVYDIFQFLLLPLVGLLVYQLTKEKGWAITVIAEVLVLLVPAAAPGWGFSVSYFWQWKEGQSKVIETLLLTASFYLGMKGRPVWSGVILGIAFFDPRFALAAIPLFLTYNAVKASLAVKTVFATLTLSNLALLYPGLGISFLQTIFSTGITTALYPYAIIPLAEVVFLTFVNYCEVRGELLRTVKFVQSRIVRLELRRAQYIEHHSDNV